MADMDDKLKAKSAEMLGAAKNELNYREGQVNKAIDKSVKYMSDAAGKLQEAHDKGMDVANAARGDLNVERNVEPQTSGQMMRDAAVNVEKAKDKAFEDSVAAKDALAHEKNKVEAQSRELMSDADGFVEKAKLKGAELKGRLKNDWENTKEDFREMKEKL